MNLPDRLVLHAAPHPSTPVRRAGFPLDHPYVEHCWAPVVGPTSVVLLRRATWLWRTDTSIGVRSEELARSLGLGAGTARNSPMARTLDRVVRFRLADWSQPGELDVYTEVPPVPERHLARVPSWTRALHDQLLGRHLDELAKVTALTAPTPVEAPGVVSLSARMDHLRHASRPPLGIV